jgi:hypothetical protein
VARQRRSELAPKATVVAWSRAAEGFRQRGSVPRRGCRALMPWCRAGLEAKNKGLLLLVWLGCWCYKEHTHYSAIGAVIKMLGQALDCSVEPARRRHEARSPFFLSLHAPMDIVLTPCRSGCALSSHACWLRLCHCCCPLPLYTAAVCGATCKQRVVQYVCE